MAGLHIVTKSKSAITEGAAASQPLFGQPQLKGIIMEGVTDPSWVMPVGITDPWTNNPDHFSAAYVCLSPAGGNRTIRCGCIDLKADTKRANDQHQLPRNCKRCPDRPNVSSAVYRHADRLAESLRRSYAFKGLANIQVGLKSSVAEPYAGEYGTANLIDNVRFLRLNPTGISSQEFRSSMTCIEPI